MIFNGTTSIGNVKGVDVWQCAEWGLDDDTDPNAFLWEDDTPALWEDGTAWVTED